MSTEQEFDTPENQDFTGTTSALQDSQLAMFEAAEAWARNPLNSERTTAFTDRANNTAIAFSNFVDVVLNANELDNEGKARAISTIFREVDIRRIEFFGELLPEVELDDSSWHGEEFVNSIVGDLESGTEKEEIVSTISDLYATIFNSDLGEITKAVYSSSKARRLRFLKKLGEHSVKIGEMSAAVLIGTVLAHRIVNRTER